HAPFEKRLVERAPRVTREEPHLDGRARGVKAAPERLSPRITYDHLVAGFGRAVHLRDGLREHPRMAGPDGLDVPWLQSDARARGRHDPVCPSANASPHQRTNA